MTTLHAVVPSGIDDTARPSGGNHYDRRLIDELRHLGWTVREHPTPGTWPTPAQSDREALRAVLRDLPDGALVLVDGLIASASAELVDVARRLRLVVLLHMPLAEYAPDEITVQVERAVLTTAAAVITTSSWSRRWVIEHLGVESARAWFATPGVDASTPAPGSASGHNLLCVGPITAAKGHDVLVDALGHIGAYDWTCTWVGALDLDPAFVTRVVADAERAGIRDRLVLTGPLTRTLLADLRAQMDLAISTSRHESYGMAVAESLACGIPVIATDVGGQREAMRQTPEGERPGALVAPGDAIEVAAHLQRWLTEATIRERWRQIARQRMQRTVGWGVPARTVTHILATVTGPGRDPIRI